VPVKKSTIGQLWRAKNSFGVRRPSAVGMPKKNLSKRYG